MNERLAHLDGLRAVSVALVFAFHAEVLGVQGGFLGVSVFFTLSGYLLTYRLLQVEPNWLSVRSYWRARWRRILPAATFVVILVVAYELARNLETGGPRRIWLTVLGLSNWLQVIDGNSYADLFAAPDMLLHYWSLAIEEQVYLLLPILLFVCLRRSRRMAVVVLTALAIVSFSLPVMLGMSLTRTYYGTDTRAGEILVGAVLAFVHVESGQRAARNHRRTPLASWGALLALAAIIALALEVRPTSEAIRTGLLPAVGLLSVAVLHGCRRDPRFAWGLFERRAVVWLGRLSYPIYLLHWPILVVLGDAGWSKGLTAVLAAVATIGLAWPLDRWVERPLRFSRLRRAPAIASGCALLALLGLSLSAPPSSASRDILERLEAQGDQFADRADEPAASEDPIGLPSEVASAPSLQPDASTGALVDATTVTRSPAPTVGVFGDSLARSVARVLAHEGPADRLPLATASTKLGCGLVTSVAPDLCATVLDNWRATLAATSVDVAIVVSCQWDVLDRDIPGVGPQTVGDPAMDARILADYRAAAQVLLDEGVEVVAWATCGEFSPTVGFPPEPEIQASRDPKRVAALNEIIGRLAARSGDKIVVLDLAPWVTARRDDASIRPDGSHFEWERQNPVGRELLRLLAPILDRVSSTS